MRSKVSSYWLQSYIKATRTVPETFKMVGYFPDSPHIYIKCILHGVVEEEQGNSKCKVFHRRWKELILKLSYQYVKRYALEADDTTRQAVDNVTE